MTTRPLVKVRPSDEWVTIGGLRCRVWIGRGPDGEPITLYTPLISYGDEGFLDRYPGLFVTAPEAATLDVDEVKAAVKRAADAIFAEIRAHTGSMVSEWIATTVPMPGDNSEETQPK